MQRSPARATASGSPTSRPQAVAAAPHLALPPGDGLYMTALVAPPIPMQSALGLSFTTAIAAQSAIASVAGFRVRDQIDIRWPNDLLLNGKKCGGILIDTSLATPPHPRYPRCFAMLSWASASTSTTHISARTRCHRDLAAPRTARPTRTSSAANRSPPPSSSRSSRRNSPHSRRNPPPPTTCRDLDLTQYSSWISGKRVRVEHRDDDPGGYTGITAGLDPSGFLRVHGDDGQLHTVLSGGLREP